MHSYGLGDLRHSCYDSTGLGLIEKRRQSRLFKNLSMTPPVSIFDASLAGSTTHV